MTRVGVSAKRDPFDLEEQVKAEFKTWAEAAEFWLDWIIFPREFDMQTTRGAVASLKRHRDVLFHEFRGHTIGEWRTPTQSPSYLFRHLARVAFPQGAKAAGRSHDAWRATILETVVQRQQKYGPTNITQGGWVGLVVRTSDKVARLDNMVEWGRGAFADESVADTWLDVVGYSGVACMSHADHFSLPLHKPHVDTVVG